jgi:hypothetical protein
MTQQPHPKPVRKSTAAKAVPSPARRGPTRARAAGNTVAGDRVEAAGSAPPVGASASAPEPPAIVPEPAAPKPTDEPRLAPIAPVVVASRADPAAAAPPPPGPRSIDRVEVERLELSRGAIGGVRAGTVAARQAVVGGVAAGHASVQVGLVNGIAAREVAVEKGAVRGVLAQNVHVEQALVRSVVANRVTTGPRTAIVVALARRIDGEATVLLDWRGALALGAVLGSLVAVVKLGRRLA